VPDLSLLVAFSSLTSPLQNEVRGLGVLVLIFFLPYSLAMPVKFKSWHRPKAIMEFDDFLRAFYGSYNDEAKDSIFYQPSCEFSVSIECVKNN